RLNCRTVLIRSFRFVESAASAGFDNRLSRMKPKAQIADGSLRQNWLDGELEIAVIRGVTCLQANRRVAILQPRRKCSAKRSITLRILPSVACFSSTSCANGEMHIANALQNLLLTFCNMISKLLPTGKSWTGLSITYLYAS